ncbi:lipase family protein [Vibrio ouci]|uniref:Lipase n=1 Tax=Vibrio ouci TaxID=2499078 RepID=A0A4Y8WL60_9VIBR|nr:lipase [Vibrio ouci]TFH93594.1 lipase [Vibrio ouci]
MDSFNYCVQCNPEDKWLELEFRSERDEPIDGLMVTITSRITPSCTYTQTTSSGKVLFRNIAAGEWRASVSQASLLTEVEKYPSRAEEQESPVKKRAITELDAEDNKVKQYRYTTIGDFWDEVPQDDFLQEHHKGVDINASAEKAGFRLSHNQTYVFEIKALRSYMPMIVDTDKFSLVNSYTFALLSQLAYANKEYGDARNEKVPQGGHDAVLKLLKEKLRPMYSADSEVTWLLDEIPYSHALKGEFYRDDTISSEGYILSNDDIAIIGVRGTETYFYNDDAFQISRNKEAAFMAEVSSRLPILKVTEVADGVLAAVGSPGYQDVLSDINASQVAPSEFEGTYVHQGFYQYAIGLWKPIDDSILKNHEGKKIYICGHSLGGAGALLLSSLIQDTYSPSTLRLYTYGMPRTGTHSFVLRYRSLVHYRHVNNHDLVPQLPMRWMNTNLDNKCDSSTLWKYLSPVLYLWDSLKERTMDCDEDNYQHHGDLVQLLTYSQTKHRPDDVKQVMLTEKQTHITSLTLASNKTEDSYRLAKTLNNDHIDINGYVDTITKSGADHMLGEYIPNLKQQVIMMLDNNMTENYQSAQHIIHQTEAKLLKAHRALKEDEMNALVMHAISRKDPAAHARREHERTQALFAIRQELKLTEKITLNVQRVRKELDALVTNPELLPNKELLFGDKSIEIQTVKEQLQ